MQVEFAEAAREEFIAAVSYDELQQPGLGLTFAEQVNAAIGQIAAFPAGWTPLDKTFHRCLVKQFPYAVIYTILDQALVIAAVMNLHRAPGYWRNRQPPSGCR